MAINDFAGLAGFSALVLAFTACGVTVLSAVAAIVKGKREIPLVYFSSVKVQAVMIVLALCALGFLLLNDAFEYPLVFNTVEAGMPWQLKLSGLWSGQASSLLFWSSILSAFIAFSVHLANKHLSLTHALIIGLLLTAGLIFYLAPVIFITNPFERLWQLADGALATSFFSEGAIGLIVPMDGQGMNPSLRHPAMLLHPPTLYIGLVGFFIPFAFAMASLAVKDKTHRWIRHVYPVVVISWIFLTAGMFLGSWWAYTILGWGGYWGWDAVEIAGLLPWLLSFGLIHSMQMQMRGKNFLAWVYLYSGLIVFFILSGILITRSGILESVHAYSSGVMGPALSILIVLNMVPFGYFYIKNGFGLPLSGGRPGKSITESLAGILNVLIIILVLICFFGQTFPLTSSLLARQNLSWRPWLYERLCAPLLFAALIVTGLFPYVDEENRQVIGDRKAALVSALIALALPIFLLFSARLTLYGASGFWAAAFLILSWLRKLLRDVFIRRPSALSGFAIGMALLHVGLGLTAVGILGAENLASKFDTSISVGERVEAGGMTLLVQKSGYQITEAGSEIYTLDILVSGPRGAPKRLAPDLEYFPKLNSLYARPAIRSTLGSDVQLIISEWEDAPHGPAMVRMNIQPLVGWMWIGAGAMLLGGVMLLLTGRRAYSALAR